jgi:hypothetical protein
MWEGFRTDMGWGWRMWRYSPMVMEERGKVWEWERRVLVWYAVQWAERHLRAHVCAHTT